MNADLCEFMWFKLKFKSAINSYNNFFFISKNKNKLQACLNGRNIISLNVNKFILKQIKGAWIRIPSEKIE